MYDTAKRSRAFAVVTGGLLLTGPGYVTSMLPAAAVEESVGGPAQAGSPDPSSRPVTAPVAPGGAGRRSARRRNRQH